MDMVMAVEVMKRNFAGLIAGISILFGAGCGDTRQYITYETIEDAKIDSAFRRGWLPLWLPIDAYKIHEYHDLDTSIRALSFSISSPDEFSWPSECKPSQRPQRAYLKTRLFPKHVHLLPNIKNCKGLFAVMDNQGVIHVWSN
ncbi:MAG: hypothetical protein COC03_06120 [Robiginitomaculum sp.]|nr:MAG: hypothetical protein COC03_06120 [Robiginitomaculum sp.]PHQ67634.1 MAG: hypothetical protein COB92_03485 [Robiginitomaculum sp.]